MVSIMHLSFNSAGKAKLTLIGVPTGPKSAVLHYFRTLTPRIQVPLDCLERYDPPLKPGYELALPYRTAGPAWRRRLFPEWTIPDIRKQGVLSPAAFAHGEPPEFVLNLEK